ncbi:hypothetical protein D3C76_1293620 [compost metagenome]
MKQHRIGKDPVETLGRQIKLQEVLLPHLATAVLTGHLCEFFRTVEADRLVAHTGERLQITTRSAAKIENVERRLALNVPQQGIDVLADVVIAGAFTEVFGHCVVMAQGGGGDLFEVVGRLFHCRAARAIEIWPIYAIRLGAASQPFASKPAPTFNRVEQMVCVRQRSDVGAGLLAKAASLITDD